MFLAITHRAVFELRPEHAIRQLLHYPTFHEGLLIVAHPNVSLPGKVVLAFHDANIPVRTVHVFRLDKLRREGTRRRATSY
jgi:hypothetical protein